MATPAAGHYLGPGWGREASPPPREDQTFGHGIGGNAVRKAIPMSIIFELEGRGICWMTRKEILIHVDDLKSTLPCFSHEESSHLHEITAQHGRLAAGIANAVDYEHHLARFPSRKADEVAQECAYDGLGPLDTPFTRRGRSVADKVLGVK